MAIREIITVPNKVLKHKAETVSDFGEELQTLIDDMVETMREAPGVGLAAPQVNILQRVIAVEFGDEDDEEVPPKLYTVVNPKITRSSRETVLGIEGCLSIPELVGEVERAESVTVKGQNRHGQPMTIKATGWLARIFQHEIDHTNGILFTDRTTTIYRVEDMIEQEEQQAALEDGHIDSPPTLA
jgi:peptide deformylase